MPIFEKACCCMSLFQGAQVFGFLSALASIYEFSLTLIIDVSVEPIDFLKSNLIFMQLLLIVASFCLVSATITGNRKLVLPWLIVFWPAIIFVNVITLCLHYGAITVLIKYEGFHARLFILGNLDGFGIYIWLCIFSYYQSLKVDVERDQNSLMDV